MPGVKRGQKKAQKVGQGRPKKGGQGSPKQWSWTGAKIILDRPQKGVKTGLKRGEGQVKSGKEQARKGGQDRL